MQDLKLTACSMCRLTSAVLKCIVNSLHLLFCSTWFSRTFSFTQASSLFLSKLSKPQSNVLTTGRINAEFYSKSALNRDNGVCFRKLKHIKCFLLKSRYFQRKKNDLPTIQWCQKDYYLQR